MTCDVETGREAAGAFEFPGAVLSVEMLPLGHINDSFVVTCAAPGGPRRFFLQRINTRVFKDPYGLVDNVRMVTGHLRAALAAEGVPEEECRRRVLTLVPVRAGGFVHENRAGCWRACCFVEGTRTETVLRTPAQAREAAGAFGEFVRRLADFPAGRLAETIPRFHDTPRRLAALAAAAETDPLGRRAGVERELDFALARHADAGRLVHLLAEGALPRRVVHNDAKAGNVLLDARTGRAVCVVDLDTVMPGTCVYDVGDMVRSAACSLAEDAPDVSGMAVKEDIFEALAEGYLAACGPVIVGLERLLLVDGARLITLETGVRFLTDYLLGDVYFKTARPGHNLDRCRTQFAFAACLEQRDARLRAIVERVAHRLHL